MTPGFTTAAWGVTKGRAEKDLIALAHDPAFKNLHPYSLRPAMVDPSRHTEIHPFLPQPGLIIRGMLATMGPLIRCFLPGYVAPTKDLGNVLVQLAMGNGAPQKEGDVGVIAGSEGRVLGNPGMRRLAGL